MNIASLLNLAGPDLIIVLFIVTLLFGAKRLPELAGAMAGGAGIHQAKDEAQKDLSLDN
ncbi:MAG: twin-arginine translocase TatA/TatE family subunit [Chthoniobacter sp.]